jgi:hypothetical protein
MKRFARLLFPLLLCALLLQSCFRPRVEDDELLEASSTIQASHAFDDLDACVSGVWKMDVYALESKYQDLNISPSMTVIAPSELTIEFRDDNTFGLFGLVTLRMDLPSGDYFELDGTHSASGGYQADGRTMTFVGTVNEIQYGTMRAYIDGELQEGLFASEEGAPPIAPPVSDFPASATYDCSETELNLQYSMLGSSVTETWARVSP